MSFIDENKGKGFEAGYFLVDDENCTRLTKTIKQNHAQVVTRADGTKYVPAGAIIPANGATAVGILYEDIDVTTGDMPGSVVTEGIVYEDRLPAAVESAAKSAMTGIKYVATTPTISRPDFKGGTLSAITVTSTAHSTTTGATVISVSGYTPNSGEKYAYKVADTTAPAAWYGMVLDSTWTVASMPISSLASADGKKITVVSVDAFGFVVAAGNTTIDVK